MKRDRFSISVTTDISLVPRRRRAIDRLVRGRCCIASTLDAGFEIAQDLAQDIHTAMEAMQVEGHVHIILTDRTTFETVDWFVTAAGIKRRDRDADSGVTTYLPVQPLDDYAC